MRDLPYSPRQRLPDTCGQGHGCAHAGNAGSVCGCAVWGAGSGHGGRAAAAGGNIPPPGRLMGQDSTFSRTELCLHGALQACGATCIRQKLGNSRAGGTGMGGPASTAGSVSCTSLCQSKHTVSHSTLHPHPHAISARHPRPLSLLSSHSMSCLSPRLASLFERASPTSDWGLVGSGGAGSASNWWSVAHIHAVEPPSCASDASVPFIAPFWEPGDEVGD